MITCHVTVVAVDCGLLPVLVNAGITSAGNTVYGSQATYECNNGHWFRRNVFAITMLCTEEGQWNNLDAACRRMLSCWSSCHICYIKIKIVIVRVIVIILA